MTPFTRRWLDGLRDFAAGHRATKPLPAATDPAAWAAEQSILGASFATRLADVGAIRAARRDRGDGCDPDPALVLTTSAAGIEAATGLLASSRDLALLVDDRLAVVTELEYRLWCIATPDDGYQAHVNLWSWIKTRVPEQRWAEFARHPLAAGEAYWLHRTGIAGAGRLDRRDCHLWKWNGRHAALLEAFVVERTV